MIQLRANRISNTIHDIKFKNVTIFIDYDICIFFGNINNDNHIEIKKNVKMPLLNKFKIEYWDDYTYNLPTASGKLALTSDVNAVNSKNTFQTTAPTEAITDGGIHIVYLSSEPEAKYDGYIYLIAE